MFELFKHLRLNNLNIVFQSAFIVYHCTETGLVKVKSDSLDYLDENKIRLLTLIDLSVALDIIGHEILVRRLVEIFGLSEQYIVRVLSNRDHNIPQSVKFGNCNSDSMSILLGVSQGFVLGSALFTLYTQPVVKKKK